MIPSQIIIIFLAMLAGMAVGSFINVAAYRAPRGESLLRPPSRCPSCKAPIRWHDNIPVAGWFIVGGRCRDCRTRFSFRYPLVELVTGLLFAAAMLHGGCGLLFARDVLFLSLLVCAVLTDLDHWIILDTVSIGGAVAGILFSLVPGGIGLLPSALSAAGAFMVFLAIRTASGLLLKKRPGYTIAPKGCEDEAEEFEGGMGWGDIKLAAMLGAFLGPSLTAVALFLAFLVGAITGIGILAAGRNRRVPIPFGPFMALGAAAALFAGSFIWGLYRGRGL